MKALITGGTSGIGFGVASQLRERGWDVTIVGRNARQGTEIASRIDASFIQADLSLMSEVQKLVNLMNLMDEPLDALVMCAGGISMRSELTLTPEGLETTFATNYLSKFALTQLLLPSIKPDGCILMVGGNGKTKKVSTDWSARDSSFKAAYKSAHAVDIYASQLAKRSKNIRIHTCYPGMVRTNLLKEAALPIRLMTRLFSGPVTKGSSHPTRLITTKTSGVHWNQDKLMSFSPPLPTDKIANELWEYSEQTFKTYLK
jgi:NAD(P)-dependent dehydrogenase (short-subunit alcohol dehydrogenase family)